MIALGMEALFALFGFFIGFGMYDPQAANPWAGISGWTTVWYLVTAGWSMFFGAWCAARLSGNPVREAGILQGITTWGFATVATMAIIVVGAWALLREGVNIVSTATIAGVAAQQAGQAVQQAQQNVVPVAQQTASVISGLALKVFGGVLLGFITALFGGWLGRPAAVIIQEQSVPTGPTRIAA